MGDSIHVSATQLVAAVDGRKADILGKLECVRQLGVGSWGRGGVARGAAA